MPQQRFDIGSKWLLQNQGKGALLVGGFQDVQRIEAKDKLADAGACCLLLSFRS